jgi:hypothetical protein
LLSDYVHPDRLPPQQLAGFQAATAGDEPAVRGDEDGPQEAELPDALGQPPEVAQVVAVAVVDSDVRDPAYFRHVPGSFA